MKDINPLTLKDSNVYEDENILASLVDDLNGMTRYNPEQVKATLNLNKILEILQQR